MNQNQRFLSLDVFRGLTVAGMILVNNPGSWSYVLPPLGHASWHGCTPTDLVFPFFLFAVGNAMSFAMKKFETMSNAAVLGKIFKRTFLIFIIGLLLSWFPFIKYDADGNVVFKTLEKLRIFGVLQRIALCYGIAALLIHYLKPKGALIATIIILLAYWWIMWFYGGPDPYSMNDHIGLAIDKMIIGENHMYRGEGVPFEPEGLLSTLPAIGNVVFGFLIGRFIQLKGKNFEMLYKLLAIGVALMALGLLWGTVFPINKKIWTSSYTLYTVGIATIILAFLIHLIELKGWKRGTYFFEVFGKNPLFIYVMSGVLVRLYGLIIIGDQSFYGWFYTHVFQATLGNYGGSLAFAIFHVLLFWLLGLWMDRKKIYIRV